MYLKNKNINLNRTKESKLQGIDFVKTTCLCSRRINENVHIPRQTNCE